MEWYAVIRDYDTTDFYGNVSNHHEIFTKANGWQSVVQLPLLRQERIWTVTR